MRRLFLTFSISAGLVIFFTVLGPDAYGQAAVFGPERYLRESGTPQTIIRTFSVANPSERFTLIVQNGESEQTRSSSAIVKLNGVIVVGPSDLNRQIGLIKRNVFLQQENTISVELRSTPGSIIIVTIELGGTPPDSTEFTLFTNPTDPLLLREETPNGEVIDFFGDRDAEGLPTSLYGFRVESANGDVARYSLDDQGRPVLIEAPNGVTFRIAWQSNTHILITTVFEDGASEVTVPVDLPPQGSNSIAQGALTQILVPDQFATSIQVRQCGTPTDNAFVVIQIAGMTGPPIQAKPVGGGFYLARIPSPPPNVGPPLVKLCKATQTVIDKACQVIQAILLGNVQQSEVCRAIREALMGSPYFEAAPLISLACTVGLKGFNFLCSATKPCIRIGEGIDRAITAPITLRPVAALYGIIKCGNTASAPPTGPFPSFVIDFPCNCQSGLGTQLFSTQRETTITILPSIADFTSEIRLLSPVNRFIATNRDAGATINIGSFGVGEELVFGIFVRDTGQTFKTGPGSGNPDGLAHARVQCLGNGKANVFFEDTLGGGDLDYNDAVFQIVSGRFIGPPCR